MNILFLGGTGFIGPPMVQSLLDDGHAVTLMHRGKTGDALFPDLEHIHADRDPDTGGLDALRGRRWDAVVDTSGYVPRVVGGSARALRDAADHYLFISTVSVYEDTPSGSDESGPLKSLEDPAVEEIRGDTYGGLKVLCEEAVVDAFGPDRSLIIRPGIIAGPGDVTDRFSYWALRGALKEPLIAPAPARREPVQFIDVRDLAEWIARLLGAGQHGIYNAVGPGADCTVERMIEGCATDAQVAWLEAPSLEGVEYWKDLPLVFDPSTPGRSLHLTSKARAMEAGLTHRSIEETIHATREWAASAGLVATDLKTGLSLERTRALLA